MTLVEIGLGLLCLLNISFTIYLTRKIGEIEKKLDKRKKSKRN